MAGWRGDRLPAVVPDRAGAQHRVELGLAGARDAGRVEAVAHRDALDGDLRHALDRLGLLDAEAVQQRGDDVDGVVVLVADLAARAHAGGPGDDARVGGAAVERVALPHLERGVERHRPPGRVVVVGLGAAQLVQHGQVGGQVVRDAVHELALVDRAVRAALAAGPVVRHDHHDRVLQLVDLLHVVQQPADLVVRVGQEAGVDLGHPREQPLLVVGQAVPRLGVVQCRERLSARSGAGLRRADGVHRRQLGALRHQAHLLLPGQDLLPGGLVAGVEPAAVAVGPFPGHVVRGVRRSGRVIQEERPVRGDGLHVVDVLDGAVGEVHREVVALLRRTGLVDRVVVVDQVRIPLVGLRAEETVEAVEAAPERPAASGRGEVHLVLGGQVPLSDGGGAEALVDQHLSHRGALGRNVPVGIREADGRLGDAGHPVRGVVAAGQQARPGRRAQGSRVPLGVAQTRRRDPVDVRGVDQTAITTETGEAHVVQHDVEHVRRSRRRLRLLVRRPVRH